MPFADFANGVIVRLEIAILTTMNISLPDEMKALVEDRVAQEGYASVSEYFRDLIHEAQRRKAKLELEAKLAEGLQGAPTRMTRKDWQAIERE
jgi:antitoxin ParD1/3/4